MTAELLSMGTEQMKRRNFEEAVESLKRYTKEAPHDPTGWLELGRTYMLRGDLDRAAPYLDRSWQEAGSECEALRLLFLVEAVRGRSKRCAEILPQIQDAGFHDSYDSLCSVIRGQQGSLPRRLSVLFGSFPSLLKLHCRYVALYWMVLLPNRLTYRLAADALWQARRQIFPDEPLEIIIRERGRFLGVRRAPNMDRLIYLTLSISDPEQALAISKEAESAYPKRWIFPLLAGHASYSMEDYPEATRHYERAVQTSKNDWLASLHLGAGLVYEERIKESREQFAATGKQNPQNPVPLFLANLSEATLQLLPRACCIAGRDGVSPAAIPAGGLPQFPWEAALWGRTGWLTNAPDWWSWRQSRKKHTAALSRRQPVPCPACLSEDVQPFLLNRASGLTLGRCPACGHVFAQPMPSDESLGALYEKQYFHFLDPVARAVERITRAGDAIPSHPFFESWLNRQAQIDGGKWEDSRGEGRTALDIGCASGACLITLRNRGWRVMGQDIGGHYRDYYRSLDIPFWDAPVEQMELEEESIDLCSMTHVIEHLADPAKSLERIASWLKPGGRLALMTPCCGTATAWIEGKDWYYMSEHVQFFTAESLCKVMRRVGLEPLYWQARVGVQGETPFRRRRELRIGGALQDLLEKTGQGDVIEMVCEKPYPSRVG